MGRPRNPAQADTTDVTAKELADQIYPEGIPKNPDGSVQEEAELSEEDVLEIGALGTESARANKMSARVGFQKNRGDKNIHFGDTNALTLFEQVRKTSRAAES